MKTLSVPKILWKIAFVWEGGDTAAAKWSEQHTAAANVGDGNVECTKAVASLPQICKPSRAFPHCGLATKACLRLSVTPATQALLHRGPDRKRGSVSTQDGGTNTPESKILLKEVNSILKEH